MIFIDKLCRLNNRLVVYLLIKRSIFFQDGMPLKLSMAEKTLHPRFQSASLYIARRTVHSPTVVSQI